MSLPKSPRLLLVSAAHFSIDAYSSFLSPLLPLLIARLHLSLTEVGALVGLATFSSSLTQPLFGYFGDRLRRPWFVAFGPVVGAVFLSAIGLAHNFTTLAVLLMIGGLGAAAFHPQAAVLAGNLMGRRRGLALSFFVTGGTLGFSLGPLYAVSVVGALGLERSWLAAIPGLVLSAVLISWFARMPIEPRHEGARPSLAELRPVLKPLIALYFAGVTRSAVSFGFMIFLSIYLHERGISVQTGGVLLTITLIAGAIGAFLGGWLTDRWGGRRIMLFSFAGAAPLYVAFLLLPIVPAMVCLTLGSLVLQCALPVNVVMGQELAPRHSSTVSSMLMGAAWGIGALMVGPIGAIADRYSLSTALLWLCTLLPIGWWCALQLPDLRRAPQPVELAPAIATVD